MAPLARIAGDPADLIRDRLRLSPVASAPEIRLYAAHPGSGLSRLRLPVPPYWAQPWGGGLVLARHVLDHPGVVRGRRVLDLGCGGGVAGIAAALAGAAEVAAVDIDPFAVAAARLNARANAVAIEVVQGDPTLEPPPHVDLILAGDVFYAPDVAERISAFLARCVADGREVLVGDPGRRDLPRDGLRLIAEAPTRDFGQTDGRASVYAFGG